MRKENVLAMVAGCFLGSVAFMYGQAPAAATPPVTPPQQGGVSQQGGTKPPPLQLQTLDPTTRADPFPPVNPRYFTATTPTVATVDSYLKYLLGYDPNRIWRVEAIQKTTAPGVSKVVIYVSDRDATAKVQSAIFFVLPDGKHQVADASGVKPFGAQPFADGRAMVMDRANGPVRGAAPKDLEIAEFVDLQSTRSKETQPLIKRLMDEFPKAHFVFEALPLTEIHPFAYQAAAFGSCVARQSADAFFTYEQAVYDTQAGLTPDGAEETLRAAVTKAGQDPTSIAACATGDAAKADVDGSVKLAGDLGVEDVPSIVVNGRVLPLNIAYETLKTIILFQAAQDGVSAAAVSPAGHGLTAK